MKMINNMKLKTRLILAFIPLALISILCGGLSVYFALQYKNWILSILLILVACGINFWAAVRTGTKITRPITKMAQAAVMMAQGDLSAAVETKLEYTSKNEIALLAQALSKTVTTYNNYVSEITNTLDTIAMGNLNVEVGKEYYGDFKKIKNALEHIISMLNKSMFSIGHSADEVSNGSEQVANASQALAQGATEQASSIQELSASLLEISEQVKKNAVNAAEANRASSDAEYKIKSATEEMNRMLQAMSDISETSTKIGDIIKTIDDIARQTNILALNAAVEAARAGAAGKGFAVVADEVRNLAGKSAEAVQDTTSLIINALEAVDKGKKITDTTANTLKEVIAATLKSTELINNIAEASNAQATSIGQVTLGVEQISAVVQTNSATAEQSAASSEEMSGQAQALKTLVKKFIIKSSVSSSSASPSHKPSHASVPEPTFSSNSLSKY
jgi:methyl-accepting chemotaxis protein